MVDSSMHLTFSIMTLSWSLVKALQYVNTLPPCKLYLPINFLQWTVIITFQQNKLLKNYSSLNSTQFFAQDSGNGIYFIKLAIASFLPW